ncbi:MAG: AmmeMemoRadiSam system radical SAM enzyme [Candidatus Omnitrophota bacterium]|nr:MAG: AmmeMemoRadiSam system radical SAM enzyme [Candidatus Omnitrophota bacterium]
MKRCLLIFLLICLVFSISYSSEKPQEALFYKKLENNAVQCLLCPRFCLIAENNRGFCRVRENKSGKLYSISYARPVAIHVDPIEKKPLFHFLPSSKAFSIATAGCNLRCQFCQNWEISQRNPDEIRYENLDPQQIVSMAVDSGSPVIAYTYTEPTIFYEYMLDTARLARQAGLKNVIHSAGFINEEPLRKLAKYLDAADIDLKAFNDDYYAKICGGSLEPVLNTLKVLKNENVHLEITTLILPGLNDNPDEIRAMCKWIKENLGADTPLHFSRFFPMYKLIALSPTPVSTLEKLRSIAMEEGLEYVYIGNVGGNAGENTYCPKCKKTVIGRKGYFIEQINVENGMCKFCKEKIAGVWN